MTRSPKLGIRFQLALLLILGLTSASPALAVTQADIEAKKAAITDAKNALDEAAAAYQDAQARLAETLNRIDETRADIARIQEKIGGLNDELAERTRTAYEAGTADTLTTLLSAESFSEFSDRLQFLSNMAEDDSSLIVTSRVTQQELDFKRDELARLSEQQAEQTAELERQKEIVSARIGALEQELKDLEAQYKKEQAAAEAREEALAAASQNEGDGGSTGGGAGPLDACPAPGASFSDDFGDARSGGRAHEGIDMLAPRGSPVQAAQSGSVSQSKSSLGGITAWVNGNDTTYYAHMDGYSNASGNVSAGTVIGYVGDSGNAQGGPTHLHFEYHPGGGAAVDPYQYLLAVC